MNTGQYVSRREETFEERERRCRVQKIQAARVDLMEESGINRELLADWRFIKRDELIR